MDKQMKVNKFLKLITLVFLFSAFSGCSNSDITSFVPGHWVADIPFKIDIFGLEFIHDNRIYESEHILTFSDASSDEYKMRYATLAEQAFSELMRDFHVSSAAELGILDQETKLTIYTIKYLHIQQMAFPYGFMLSGEDSEIFSKWPEEMKPRFYNQVKHEMMHVMQFLFGALPNSEYPKHEPEKWFNEGIAEYASGGFFIPIRTKAALDLWKNDPDHINPLKIKEWKDLPISDANVGEYYPVFGLAVRYLLSDRGMNKSLQDVKNMFLLLAEDNTDFEIAFEQYMGISLSEYENTFYGRMDVFLE
jgi:hypothetical protein